ncbi:Variant-specific surface protein [Giardia duodenalis]|uniref:Variant-specific surface protein n=1 Tax=Giardia intestinalis TaxID=5741 RepID=V6TM77_GIAIN|nr:Variant-specific surface protein [Giardia intestinalis]
MHGVTEVEGLCGAMGVLEDAEGGLWGGELPHTGGVGLRRTVRVGGVLQGW